jgi:hypothetical protein
MSTTVKIILIVVGVAGLLGSFLLYQLLHGIL